LSFELVPGLAALIDEMFLVEEDGIGQPVLAQELPDVLLGVEFRALRRERHQGDVAGHDEIACDMPAGLIEQQRGMASRRDVG